MKYYILNKQQVKQDIWVNPILIRTKSLAKIKKDKKFTKEIRYFIKSC